MKEITMDRREALKLSLLAGVGLAAGGAQAQQACATDGTPAQFTPKKAADAKPLENELDKYQKCPTAAWTARNTIAPACWCSTATTWPTVPARSTAWP
jgi:hypothetical protein